MNDLEADPNIAVVIFTGRRSIFMTGAALGEIAVLKEWSAAVEYLELPHSIVSQFCNSGKVLIAAINGYCLGGGLELALACDLRLAVDQVRDVEGRGVPFLGFPEAQLGLVPALCGAYLAEEILGLARAKELFFVAEPITAEHALRIGLVNAVASRETLMDEALQLAQKIAANSSSSLALTKRLLHLRRDGASLEGAMRETRNAFAECCVSADTGERIRRLQAERVGKFRNSVGAGRA